MAGTLVFVPVAPAQARAVVAGEVLADVQAFALTAELWETVGLDRGDDEGAERACMLLASVWGLARHGRRLVLVAEVPASQVMADLAEGHNGGVRLGQLSPAAVQAFFTDDPADPLPARAAASARGLDLDEAWELDDVQQLLRSSDLLWHGAEELAVAR